MKINNIKKSNKIAILWYWKEGKSSLDFLLRLSINKNNIEVLDQNKNLKIKGIKVIGWDNYLSELEKYDVIIKSPWISPYKNELIKYYNKIITQTSIFFENKNDIKVIWVTATKGKSTTVSIIYELLKNTDLKIKLVWNIWKPVLDEIDLINNNQSYDFVIYELSSYMLENLKPKCDIAILGNIYKCHLDWHWNSYQKYIIAKTNILENSKYKLVSSDFPSLWDKLSNVQFFWTSWKYTFYKNELFINNEKVYSWNVLLEWDHNKKNISAALWVLDYINTFYNKINIPEILELVIPSFSWLPHRMEKIWTYKWITFVDDWISTTPESTIEALKTYNNDIESLLLWWWDYWFTDDSYKELRNNITKFNIKNIVIFPDTWTDIFGLDKNKYKYWDDFKLNINWVELNILYTNKMYDAIKFVYEKTSKWKICIMSCAAPSYSLWSWYKEKWKDYLDNILLLK